MHAHGSFRISLKRIAVWAAIVVCAGSTAVGQIEPGEWRIEYADGKVTIHAVQAGSNAILRDLAEKAGFEAAVTPADDRVLTLDLADATVEEALQALSENYSVVFGRNPEGGYRVLKVTSGGVGAMPPEGSEPAGVLTARDVVREIRKKVEGVKRFQADTRMTMTMMGQEMVIEGRLLADGGKFRMEMSMPMMGGAKQITVNDGERIQTYIPQMNMVQVIDQKKLKEVLGPDAAGMGGTAGASPMASGLDGMKEDSLRYLGTETVDGVTAHVLEGDLKSPPGMKAMPMAPKSQTVWIDATSGMMRKAEFRNADGAPMMTQEFVRVQTDPDWEGGDPFTLNLPEDVQRVDMTQMVLSMMQSQMSNEGDAEPSAPTTAPPPAKE